MYREMSLLRCTEYVLRMMRKAQQQYSPSRCSTYQVRCDSLRMSAVCMQSARQCRMCVCSASLQCVCMCTCACVCIWANFRSDNGSSEYMCAQCLCCSMLVSRPDNIQKTRTAGAGTDDNSLRQVMSDASNLSKEDWELYHIYSPDIKCGTYLPSQVPSAWSTLIAPNISVTFQQVYIRLLNVQTRAYLH